MTAICSWCSAEVAEGATQCSSCGANLVPEADTDVPGVTAVDAASIIRSKSASQPRSRLLSWISGEYQPDVPSKAEQQAIAPPDIEVRREILRLELEAEVANLQAEADAIRAEAAAEGRVVDFTGEAVAPEAESPDVPEAAEVVAKADAVGHANPDAAAVAATSVVATSEAEADTAGADLAGASAEDRPPG